MSQSASREVVRLVVCLLGGVIFGVALLELLVAVSVVTVFDYGADVLAGFAGLGAGLLRYGGPSRVTERV